MVDLEIPEFPVLLMCGLLRASETGLLNQEHRLGGLTDVVWDREQKALSADKQAFLYFQQRATTVPIFFSRFSNQCKRTTTTKMLMKPKFDRMGAK